jgi:hypothetical protein
MAERFIDPLPGESPSEVERLHQILEFWEQLEVGGDPGETMWGELEPLKDQVTSALKQVPMDLARAETLTAYAALLSTGQTEF